MGAVQFGKYGIPGVGKFSQESRTVIPAPPAPVTPPGGAYSPSIDIVGGLIATALTSAKYLGNYSGATGILNVTARFVAIADTSNALMIVEISNPFAAHFTGSNQAQISGFTIIRTSNLAMAGAVGDGWFHDLTAVSGGGVLLSFEGALPSVSYTINAGWMYQIQSPPLTNKKGDL